MNDVTHDDLDDSADRNPVPSVQAAGCCSSRAVTSRHSRAARERESGHGTLARVVHVLGQLVKM
jgi:hypothetical protein